MEYEFITDGFKAEINNNVMKSVFPILNNYHREILLTYLLNVIEIIAIKFNFNITTKNKYEQQFRQNNYRDTVGLLLMLLPYIDDTSGEKKKQISSLDELYIKKKDDVNYDISNESPRYEYTNLQYGRCQRLNNGKEIRAVEIKFSEEHLKHNYYLLLDTIKTVANKLYVNWVNIRPVNPEYLDSYVIFHITDSQIKKHEISTWDPYIDDNGHHNRGMDASEMYNILVNYLYYPIKTIKWTIYEIYIDNKGYKYLSKLNELINIDPCIKNISWNQLQENEKDIFSTQWKVWIDMILNNQSGNNIPTNKLYDMMYVLITFFDSNYKKKTDDNYIRLPKKSQLGEDDSEEEIEINIEAIKSTAKSLYNYPEYIYEYIRDSLIQLKNTWYGIHYFHYNEITKEYELDKDESPNIIEANITTIKNIYNFAKSLTIYGTKQPKQKANKLARQWKSLSNDDKQLVLDRLNRKKDDWFNIKGYLTKIVGLNRSEAETRNKEIYDNIEQQLARILYYILASQGLLSMFVPSPHLTDYTLLPTNTNERNNEVQRLVGKEISNNEVYRKSYYFINNKQYEELDLTLQQKDLTIKSMKYLEAIGDTSVRIGNWINFYAMDWISQISFFHHYLNNRIIYVTGGTGVGKSSQIPKLLLYALKMIDYKINGSIVCTQPRIPPTIGNAKTISSQMGIPIETYDHITKNNIRTDNYNIQYKYKEKGHDKTQPGLTLKFMTDGLLDAQLQNPILKKLAGKKFTEHNIYDIVIVDEAHEHNPNMDLILTKMKYATYFNNDLKLVIISATMDDDEPTYRRYYRDINDNKMYPLNLSLEEHNLDRINVDRRIHISPPGETTQYKIEEIYEPTKDPVNLVIEIINKTTDGDILLFQPGQKDIMESVAQINAKTPYNTIAIPYYGEMGDKKREFVDNISSNKSKITIPKDVPFSEDVDDLSIKKVPLGTYKRVIVVATNIAEASITIDTLKYVVDTGRQKTGIYDYKLRTTKLPEGFISESSRLQRKGRVGRVANGTVYYIYDKGSMEKNKKQYGISIIDFSDKLFELLYVNSDEKLLFDKQNDPNNVVVKYENGIDAMIQKQYMTNDGFYNYYGDESHYDYDNNTIPYNYYETGLDKTTLDDETGSFYIVHPNELCFRRNIRGEVVAIEDDCKSDFTIETSNYISAKMNILWNVLAENLLVVINKNKAYKTEFGSKIMYFKQKITILPPLTINQVLSIVYSRSYNCYNEMLTLIAMYTTISSAKELIKGGVVNGKYRIQFDDAMKIYGNCEGDSTAILKICDDFLDYLFKFNIEPTDETRIRYEVEKQKQYFLNKDYSKLDSRTLDNFIQLKNTNKLTTNKMLSNFESDKMISSNTYLLAYLGQIRGIKNELMIKQWCDKRYLNYVVMDRFLETYMRLLNEMKKYEKNLYEEDFEISQDRYTKLDWFDNHTPKLINSNEISKTDRIKIALLYGYNYNLSFNISIINDNYYYLNIFNPDFETVYKINKLFPAKGVTRGRIANNTFLDSTCMKSTILYINKSEDKESGDIEMTLIENIPVKLIARLFPYIIKKDKYNITIHERYIKEFIRTLVVQKSGNDVYQNLISKYIKTIENIRYHLFNNMEQIAYDKLSVIDDRIQIKQMITQINTIQTGGKYSFTEMSCLINNYVRDLVYILNKKS